MENKEVQQEHCRIEIDENGVIFDITHNTILCKDCYLPFEQLSDYETLCTDCRVKEVKNDVIH